MTLHRSAKQLFRTDVVTLTRHIYTVAMETSIYHDFALMLQSTTFEPIFKVRIQPSRLLLGTDMYIFLRQNDKNTLVTIDIKSQAFIFGDAFGVYDRYVTNFFDALQRIVQQDQPSIVAVGEFVFINSTNLGSIAVLAPGFILAIFLFLQSSPSMSWLILPFLLGIGVSLLRAMRAVRSQRLFSNSKDLEQQ